MEKVIMRFVWTRRGLWQFMDEVDRCCCDKECPCKVAELQVHRGLLGLRWLVVAILEPCGDGHHDKHGGELN